MYWTAAFFFFFLFSDLSVFFILRVQEYMYMHPSKVCGQVICVGRSDMMIGIFIYFFLTSVTEKYYDLFILFFILLISDVD